MSTTAQGPGGNWSRQQQTVLTIAIMIGVAILLVTLVAVLKASQEDQSPKDFSSFGCEYVKTSLDNGYHSGHNYRWYHTHCR